MDKENEQNQLLENQEELTEVETEDVVETPDDTPDDKKVDWKARALRAEALIVEKKKEVKKTKPITQEVKGAMTQKDFLKFNGLSDEEIENLEKIAQVEGTDLITAKSSPLFVAYKETLEKEKVSQQATVEASKRGNQIKKNLDQKINDFGKKDTVDVDEALELIKEHEGLN